MKSTLISLLVSLAISASPVAQACTGISLKATDGAVVAGRTVE